MHFLLCLQAPPPQQKAHELYEFLDFQSSIITPDVGHTVGFVKVQNYMFTVNTLHTVHTKHTHTEGTTVTVQLLYYSGVLFITFHCIGKCHVLLNISSFSYKFTGLIWYIVFCQKWHFAKRYFTNKQLDFDILLRRSRRCRLPSPQITDNRHIHAGGAVLIDTAHTIYCTYHTVLNLDAITLCANVLYRI